MHFFLSPGKELPFGPAGVWILLPRNFSLNGYKTFVYTPSTSPPKALPSMGMRLEVPWCRAVTALGC
jgi:hypothetical protein